MNLFGQHKSLYQLAFTCDDALFEIPREGKVPDTWEVARNKRCTRCSAVGGSGV
jgi:hypothetical protein